MAAERTAGEGTHKMAGFEIIPKDNPLQAHRLQRYFVAVGTSLLVLVFMAGLYLAGRLERDGLIVAGSGMLFCFVLFYVLFRSGLNLRFGDPSLTTAQIASSFVVLTLAMFYSENASRGVFTPLILMSFIVGVFRLDTKRLLILALIAVGCYAVLIACLMWLRPEVLDANLEFFRLWVLTGVVIWFAFMGGYVSGLRKQLADSKAALMDLATRDELTGTHNRRYLVEMLRQEKSRCDRNRAPFCIAILDLDFFKKINDTFGHHGGDEVLREFARCAVEQTRPTDCFGRWGGEEFMLVLSETRLEGARVRGERLRGATEQLEFSGLNPGVTLTVSIGISQYRPGEDIEQTQKRADEALYRAKMNGRNRVEVQGV